jgi:acetolactate synthase regulatory subunit
VCTNIGLERGLKSNAHAGFSVCSMQARAAEIFRGQIKFAYIIMIFKNAAKV